MTSRNRSVFKVWIRATWLPGLVLAAGLVFTDCGSKDPVEPTPLEPEPTFSVTFADGVFEAAFQTSIRGGYVAAGTGADGQGFIYKINPDGTEVTHYVFDQNASAESVVDVLPVDDGGYMVCGEAGVEGWVAKIDGQLQTVENNLYNGSAREDNVKAMAVRTDGGFLVGGEYDWDRTTSTGDGWLLQVSSGGVYESQFSFGGGARDYVLALTPTGDGGFFVGGGTYPSPSADTRAWICKTNAAADALVWNKSYFYTHSTTFSGLAATPDGGCLCVGGATRMETPSTGMSDAYVLKVDASGEKLWAKNSGIDGADSYRAITRAHDGGYVCVGMRWDISSAWLVKIDDNGNIVWEKTFSGNTFYSVEQTSGNGYVCAGTSGNKAWLLRVDINGDF
jgi:hypothetical protein